MSKKGNNTETPSSATDNATPSTSREANALGAGGDGGGGLHECCDECKRTCKRHFWTEVLRTFVKIGTAVLAAFGIASCIEGEDTL